MVSDRGSTAALRDRVQDLWQHLGHGASFAPVPRVAVRPESRLCSPGWAGLVVIGDAILITAPDRGSAGLIERALGGVPMAEVTSAQVLGRRLAIAEMRGPATLAYLDPSEFQPVSGDVSATPLDLGHADFRRFLRGINRDDLEESGIEEISSPACTVRAQGRVVAAAGYQDWPEETAHLSVLTAPDARGRGLGRVAASAAVALAVENQKLAQWRARLEASRRVARALGFRELGAQVSIRLGAAG